MPETVLFESERRQSRGDIAAYLRQVAEKLDAGAEITLKANGERVTLNPPDQPTFEVKAEREGPTDGTNELSIEFELEWDEGESGSGGGTSDLQIE
jgi:amphi-Trp domain-containing protein